MYASKHYAYEPPVYRARNLLAALDYNQHVNRGIRISQAGNQGYAFSTKFVQLLVMPALVACYRPASFCLSAIISTVSPRACL